MKLKYDQEILEFMSLFSKFTSANIKDCFKEDGTYYCIIEQGDLGKAIGKKGSVIRTIKERLKIPVRVIEYHANPEQFIRNIIFPVKVENIEQDNGMFIIEPPNSKTRSLLIGRDGKHIKLTNKIVKRFFPVEEVKVI